MSAKQFILGLNSFNCKSKISNVNWDNNLSQPLTITEGDQINVRNVFLDTRTQSTNGIIIAEDTEISLDFYFYYINRGGNQQPSPFDVSLNNPGQPSIPQPIQTGMFDFLNPLNYSVGANAGSIAPQLIPPEKINILSLSRASDIATCTLIPTTKSIPLSTQVSIVEIGSNIPPIVSFDATNVTISDITYTETSTTFQYASSGPDESVEGSVEEPVGICFTNGKLLPTASSPNIGNKAPLVESVMYPDFYGGFIPGQPNIETGINENAAAMLPQTNYTAYIDYNNPANAGITKVEAGWLVSAQDMTQQLTGQNLQQSPGTQTEGVSYDAVFDSGAYPDLDNVQAGDLVTFPGFTGTPQMVTGFSFVPNETQVLVVMSLDPDTNNPFTSTTLLCETPTTAPFPGIGGFITNINSSFYVTLNETQVIFTESAFGFCMYTTYGGDITQLDYEPIEVGYTAIIGGGEASGLLSDIQIINGTNVQFTTNIPYNAIFQQQVQFSTTIGNFYEGQTTMVNYNETTFEMTMSNVTTAQLCGEYYYGLDVELHLIIQNADYIIIDYIATQTIYVQDLIFTFTPTSSFLNSIVSSTAYITSPVTAYAITFPTDITSIPTPNGLIMTFTQDRPTFSNLSNLNNFSIPMNLNSGDGLPYLAYMNLSQADNQGNPTGVCDPTKRVPIKKRWKMTIKAGSYSADRLAQIISRNMSRQKNKIQRNYYLNTELSIAVTPTDGINKQYRGLIQYTEPYNPIPIDVPVAVPAFLLENFAGYANGAFTQGYPNKLYNPSRYFLSKNPAAYPQNSDLPLTTAKLAGLSPDYESQYIFDDDDQPFLFRPTSYAKPNPLAITEPTTELTATQQTTNLNLETPIPDPIINPMTEAALFTSYFPNFETTLMTSSGQTTFALYVVNQAGYDVVADDNLYQIQIPNLDQFGISSTDDVQFLLSFLVVWTGMDNTVPAPQINNAAYNDNGYFAFNFDYVSAVPVGGSFDGIFSFIFPLQLPLIQITEAWTATRQNLGTTNPGTPSQVVANIFNNEIYSYEISFTGDETIADTSGVQILFTLAGQAGDINQREDYLYSAGMCYNDANLFKWNKMQPNLIAPPNLVDVYFGPFLTDCYSPFFQNEIKNSNVSTGGYDVNGLSSYYAIRPVITQQMEYIIYENTTLVENGGDVDVSSNYLFAYAPNYEVVCPLIGASEMSLVYNAENNGIFQFNYAHTPLYAKVASGTSSTIVESVGQYPSYIYPDNGGNDGDTVKLATPEEGVFQSDKQSGIILAAMNPPAFWELLGFDIAECVANPPSNDVGAPFMTFEEFAVKTTGGFSGSGNNFDTSIVMVGDSLQCYAAAADTFSLESGVNVGLETSASIADPFFINKYTQTPIFYEVQNTNTIDAASIPLAPSAAGFWLVEITGYSSEFITDIEKMEVKAIVNGYFSQGGAFATTNGSDSYSYRHAGQPIQLSNLKIRILNPITGQEDKTLGPNNSVYLEISKQIPAPNLPIINNDSNVQVPWSNPNPPPPPKK